MSNHSRYLDKQKRSNRQPVRSCYAFALTTIFTSSRTPNPKHHDPISNLDFQIWSLDGNQDAVRNRLPCFSNSPQHPRLLASAQHILPNRSHNEYNHRSLTVRPTMQPRALELNDVCYVWPCAMDPEKNMHTSQRFRCDHMRQHFTSVMLNNALILQFRRISQFQ